MKGNNTPWSGAAPDWPAGTPGPSVEVIETGPGSIAEMYDPASPGGYGAGQANGAGGASWGNGGGGGSINDASDGNGAVNALSEIGITGLNRVTGFVYEEMLPELRGERGRRQIRMMIDDDAIIGAILFIVEMLCRQVRWDVEPASEDNDDLKAADFIRQCLFEDMETNWQDTIAEVLTMLPWGWSLMESVYKMRAGEHPEDETHDSMFDDGKIGLRRLSPRAQETLFRWQFDSKGKTKAMVQLAPPYFRFVQIPLEKALLFRATSRKDNPEGRSILRNAYSSWYYARNIRRIEAIGVERDLAGFPMAWMPPQYLSPRATPEQKSMVAATKRMVTNIRRDEMEGAVFPLQYDAKGNKVFDFTLLTSGGNRNFDTDKIVTRYEQRIAQSVMAEFIMLGMDQVGSFALASSKTNLFAIGIGTFMDAIVDVLRVQVKRLLLLNGLKLKNQPKITHGDIENIPLPELAQYITALSGAGFPLFPSADGKLEKYFLDLAGLPAATDLSVYQNITQPMMGNMPLGGSMGPAQPVQALGGGAMGKGAAPGGGGFGGGNPAGGDYGDAGPGAGSLTPNEHQILQQRQGQSNLAMAASEYHQTLAVAAQIRAHELANMPDEVYYAAERAQQERDQRLADRRGEMEHDWTRHGFSNNLPARDLVGGTRSRRR